MPLSKKQKQKKQTTSNLISPAMGLIESLLFFYEDGFSIK